MLTPHFTRREFRCPHLRDDDPVWSNILRVAEALEVLRDVIKRPIYVISGYRCPECNQKCGGVPKSQHLVGKAADIRVAGLSIKEIAGILEELMEKRAIPRGGIGLYYRGRPNQGREFLHYDIRGRRLRWIQGEVA